MEIKVWTYSEGGEFPNRRPSFFRRHWKAFLIAFVAIALAAAAWSSIAARKAIGGGMYNSLNASRQTVDADWAQVENVMQRRADLIPNLVASVKGEMQNEQEIFKSIAESRKQFETSDTQAGKLVADDELNEQTTVLLNAVKESYPELASSEQVKTLMTQLEGSENRISVERKRYIDDVAGYNRKVTSFPMNLIAKPFGFDSVAQYKAAPSAANVPVVDFN